MAKPARSWRMVLRYLQVAVALLLIFYVYSCVKLSSGSTLSGMTAMLRMRQEENIAEWIK